MNQIPIGSYSFEIVDLKRHKAKEAKKGISSGKPYSRLFFVVDGWISKQFQGNDFLLCPGERLLLPPNIKCDYSYEKGLDLVAIFFDAKIFQTFDLFESYSCNYKSIGDLEENFSYFKQLIHWFEEKDSYEKKLKLHGLMHLILAPFLENLRDHKGQDFENISRFEPVLKYIDQNLCKAMTLDELARLVYLNESYFSTMFKRTFQCSPFTFIIQKRIQRAKVMLWETDDQIGKISDSLGFSDSFHFSKTFKKVTNQTPKEFRKSKFSSEVSKDSLPFLTKVTAKF